MSTPGPVDSIAAMPGMPGERTAARERVLLIDADDRLRRTLQLLLAGNGYDVRSFASATQALADPDSRTASHLLVGDPLPDSCACDVVATLRARGWRGRAVRLADARQAAADRDFAAAISRRAGRIELLNALSR